MSYYYSGRRKRSVGSIALFVLFLIGIGLMVALYYVKTLALSARSEVHELEQYVAEEQSAINVLQAEIAYLENPERLAQLAKAELGLEPISVDQIITENEIATNFAIRPQASVASHSEIRSADTQGLSRNIQPSAQPIDIKQEAAVQTHDGGR